MTSKSHCLDMSPSSFGNQVFKVSISARTRTSSQSIKTESTYFHLDHLIRESSWTIRVKNWCLIHWSQQVIWRLIRRISSCLSAHKTTELSQSCNSIQEKTRKLEKRLILSAFTKLSWAKLLWESYFYSRVFTSAKHRVTFWNSWKTNLSQQFSTRVSSSLTAPIW